MADNSFTLTLSQTDDLCITAALADTNGNLVPTVGYSPTWTEDSAGAVLAIEASTATSVTVRKVAAGKATVTYSVSRPEGGDLTAAYEVIIVDEPVSVGFSAALVAPAPEVAPVEAAPAEPSAEPAPIA